MSSPLDSMPDARVFTVTLSRRDFRRLSITEILIPSLDGPVLCYPDHERAQAEVWLAELSQIRLRYIQHGTARLEPSRRSSDRKFVGMLLRARQLHTRLVALAEGYTWPGSLNRYTVEFVPDV